VGKTTVSSRVATKVGASVVSIDQILDERGLWVSGRLSEFLQANAIAAGAANRLLRSGVPVIFDGNFYWKSQILDLRRRVRWPFFAFTLNAPVEVCIQRDRGREVPHGEEAARAVFTKVAKVACGTEVDATLPIDDIVAGILIRLPRSPAGDPRPVGRRQ
jgi:predicted kinase